MTTTKKTAPRKRPADIARIVAAVAALEHLVPGLARVDDLDEAEVTELYRLADRILMVRRIVWLKASNLDSSNRAAQRAQKEALVGDRRITTARNPRTVRRAAR